MEKRFYLKTEIILLIFFILLMGCGKKGPPVPWSTIVPKRIVDLEAKVREGRLLLEWTLPKENTDKSILTDLVGFRILRSESDLVEGECRGCGEGGSVVFEGRLDEKGGDRGKRMSLFFEDLWVKKIYVYQVITVNKRGHLSSPSNPVFVYWDSPPSATGMVKAERGDKRVDLEWETVGDATGYNIYRRLEDEEFPINPLNREPLKENRYTDLNVENEKRYIYSIRAVKKVVKTDVEGKGTLSLPITPTDIIPPSPPSGIVAIPLRDGIELSWRRNREPDLMGYHVYRRRVGEGEFKRLTQEPLKKEIYLDINVKLGQEYEYAISALDNSPRKNESHLSEEVRVKYLY